jgi:hypothetical protein
MYWWNWSEENSALKYRAIVRINEQKLLFCLNQNSNKRVNGGHWTMSLLSITYRYRSFLVTLPVSM